MTIPPTSLGNRNFWPHLWHVFSVWLGVFNRYSKGKKKVDMHVI